MTEKERQTAEAYFANSGWSSHLFLPHAKLIWDTLAPKHEIDIFRDRAFIRGKRFNIYLYPHFNGRTEEYLTITDAFNKEITTFHHSVAPELILKFLKGLLK